MPLLENLCQILGITKVHRFTKPDIIFLEALLFTKICDELKEKLKIHYQDYFSLMKFDSEMEDTMLENDLMRYVINDILSTEEYSLEGIAYYTRTPTDVIYDLATGYNTHPSLPLSKKILNLHSSLRPHLYREILKKLQPCT